jgi:hypothetical protein
MSFNRLKYDMGATQKSVDESVAPGYYQINTPVNCGNCLQTNPRIMMQKTGVSINDNTPRRFYAGPVDVESELFNLNRPISRDPNEAYQPVCPNCKCQHQGQPCGAGGVPGCTQNGTSLNGKRCGDQNLIDFPVCYLPTEDTRLSNPACNIRGMTINRFEPLCVDPQKQIFFPGSYQVQTRLVMKDNWRPCVPQPAVNDMLPPKKELPVEYTKPTNAPFRGALYQFDVCG